MENTVGLLTDLFSAKKMDCKCPAKADMLLTETCVETPCIFTRRQSKDNPLKRTSMDVLHDGPEENTLKRKRMAFSHEGNVPQTEETPGKRRTETEEDVNREKTENDSEASYSFVERQSEVNPQKRKSMDVSHEELELLPVETPGERRRTETEEDVNREKTENDSEASYSFLERQSEVNPQERKSMDVSHEELELLPEGPPGKRRTEAEEKDVNREKTENDSEASYSFVERQSEVNPRKRKRTAVSHEEPELLPEGPPGKRRRTETEENHEKSENYSYSFARSQSKTNPLTEENQEKTGTQPVRRINPFREAKFHGRYLLGELLGQGGFGAVYAGIRKSNGQKVAVKIAFKQEDELFTTLPGETRRLPLEVALMELVCKPPRCPHVIELLEWFETPTFFILVLEFPDPCVNLYKYCSSLSDAMSESQVKTIMRQIIWAAIHCQGRGVIHRDIKEENILINPKTLEVKLIDFGCGALLNDSHNTPFAGTTLFLPPELIVKGEYEAEPVTVWSLGILMYSLLCGQEPIYDHYNIGEGDMYIPGELSEASCKLINWCLQSVPERRPSLEDVILDNWFTT